MTKEGAKGNRNKNSNAGFRRANMMLAKTTSFSNRKEVPSEATDVASSA
jgi:hypothetical protein